MYNMLMGNGGITDPQEFWNALGRLYDSIVELKQQSTELHASISELAAIAKSHENRLDSAEIRVLGFYDNFTEIKTELKKIRERLDHLERPEQ